MPVDMGCELGESWPWTLAPDHRPVCCRATGNPGHRDYHEPREPHLIEDGFPEDYFLVVGKVYRRRRYERRARGGPRRRHDLGPAGDD